MGYEARAGEDCKLIPTRLGFLGQWDQAREHFVGRKVSTMVEKLKALSG